MRGGFVACLATSGPTASRLESAAACITWHHGEHSFHRHRRLQIACLVDDAHGPIVEIGSGRLLLCHGAPPEPLEALERRDRFVGVESDGISLRAIRDPMGEVPLFYRRLREEFWLATEIHPLLAVAPATPDLAWLAAFSAMVEHPDATGWMGVRRALPGETLQVHEDLRVSSTRYFLPSIGGRCGGPTRSEAARRFRELFSTAVEKRSSARCGVLLSGGLDSSAVAVVAAQTTRPTLLTTTHPGLPEVDETGYAQAVADATSLTLATLKVEPDVWDPADDVRMFGAPPRALPTGTYAQGLGALAAAGCDVALDGHDGDGALGNQYAWPANTLLDARVDRLARAALEYGLPLMFRQLAKEFVPPSVWRLLRRSPASPDYRSTFLRYFRGDTRRRLAEESCWQWPRRGWEHTQVRTLVPPLTQSFEEIELLGARAGIDVQHPFADRDLLEFLVALPHAVKASTARPKPVLRDALEGLLPRVVAERDDKTYFTAVLDARVDFDACYRSVRDAPVRLPDIDYGRLFRDAARPVNDRIFWTRLAKAHAFLSGAWA